jgi:hypothetical protein
MHMKKINEQKQRVSPGRGTWQACCYLSMESRYGFQNNKDTMDET